MFWWNASSNSSLALGVLFIRVLKLAFASKIKVSSGNACVAIDIYFSISLDIFSIGANSCSSK